MEIARYTCSIVDTDKLNVVTSAGLNDGEVMLSSRCGNRPEACDIILSRSDARAMAQFILENTL